MSSTMEAPVKEWNFAEMTVKQQAILLVAERLFHDHGFHATGIDAITAEAGVTPRTLYKHFGGKDALIDAVLDYREQCYFHNAETIVRAGEGDAIDCEIAAICHWLEEKAAGGCMFLAALNEYGDPNGSVAKRVNRYKAVTRDRLNHAVRLWAHDQVGLSDHQKAALSSALYIASEGAIADAAVEGGIVAGRRLKQAAILMKTGAACAVSFETNEKPLR